MAKKVKLSKINIVLIVILSLLLTTVCLFVIKNNQKRDIATKPAISALEQIELDIKKDVANNNVQSEYNGKYKLSSIVDISFEENLSNEEETAIYSIFNAKDKNTFATYIYNNKKSSTSDEIICFSDGLYSKSKNRLIIEKGLFYGNLNKSYVYVQNNNGTVMINNILHSIDFEISKTAYWVSKNLNGNDTKIYIREKFYYDETNNKFFYVTYSYERV